MKALGQFTRYGIVGIASNGVLYIFYLLITGAGLGHKLAATLAYSLGVLQTYIFNKSWSFDHSGQSKSTFLRYVAAYFIGFVINIATLSLLVDIAGYPHQIVQGAMIIVLAILLFLLQKFWVFSGKRTNVE